jgi:hypothetical protein
MHGTHAPDANLIGLEKSPALVSTTTKADQALNPPPVASTVGNAMRIAFFLGGAKISSHKRSRFGR